MTRGRKPNPNKVEKESVGRGRKSTKSDEERFCPETVRSGRLFGCKKQNDGRFYPSACTLMSYKGGCKFAGTKRHRKSKTEAVSQL